MEPVRDNPTVESPDGATAQLQLFHAAAPRAHLLWVAAMGIAARHYEPLARALASRGVTVGLHEWRGIGSSDHRASRWDNWGYRELLAVDLPASRRALTQGTAHLPLYVGGHSLGGQLACLMASLGEPVAGIALVASGAPYWRNFSTNVGLAYVAAPMLAAICGYLPGRRIGFGGREARGVISDWARTGRTGRYAARGVAVDMEAALRRQTSPILGIRLADDWLAPASSLDYLLDKMPLAARDTAVLDADDLGGQKADHFAWMKAPEAIAARIARWIP
ncbi:putative alpha/beta hydrolase [Luteibacter sp. Sphag1AF]|uniref:alpha/beta hydrolase family protein n=1 Tax=Luteibacter sp. Sphag1AF TaxID=2587031 RepID=UPI0017E968BE|nr:alpha/beta fold hydrolase [Luteibacter sp. Sphag1AF]MBB3227148.1 putative alpha/beta hydrolase [Luteibacter sp. Sphag1AF]